jgi:UDP-glucuronate decarboxylase
VWQRSVDHDVSFVRMQALKGEMITVYGDGKQTRSFQYVSDLIAGMILVMGTDSNDSGPYNVGNPGEFTMLELAEFVKQARAHHQAARVFMLVGGW